MAHTGRTGPTDPRCRITLVDRRGLPTRQKLPRTRPPSGTDLDVHLPTPDIRHHGVSHPSDRHAPVQNHQPVTRRRPDQPAPHRSLDCRVLPIHARHRTTGYSLVRQKTKTRTNSKRMPLQATRRPPPTAKTQTTARVLTANPRHSAYRAIHQSTIVTSRRSKAQPDSPEPKRQHQSRPQKSMSSRVDVVILYSPID